MTLQLLHSEFPYIYEEHLIFFFISVLSPQGAGRRVAGGPGLR